MSHDPADAGRHHGAHAAPQQRLIWPWALGGSLALALLAALVLVGVFFLSALAAQEGIATAARAAEAAVLDLDEAYREADCEAFEGLVAEPLRDEIVDGSYACDDWRDLADALVVDGEYGYEVEIVKTSVRGDTATVSTDESWVALDGGVATESYVYTLERSDGDWVIVDYDVD